MYTHMYMYMYVRMALYPARATHRLLPCRALRLEECELLLAAPSPLLPFVCVWGRA